MMLNSDFDTRATIHGGQLDWTPSPIPGVDQRILYHAGEEIVCTTSIVRYEPGSRAA